MSLGPVSAVLQGRLVPATLPYDNPGRLQENDLAASACLRWSYAVCKRKNIIGGRDSKWSSPKCVPFPPQ